MAPDPWAESDGMSQHSDMSHQDDSLDRQLLRHLMRRYGRDGIAQLMDEEATSPAIARKYFLRDGMPAQLLVGLDWIEGIRKSWP